MLDCGHQARHVQRVYRIFRTVHTPLFCWPSCFVFQSASELMIFFITMVRHLGQLSVKDLAPGPNLVVVVLLINDLLISSQKVLKQVVRQNKCRGWCAGGLYDFCFLRQKVACLVVYKRVIEAPQTPLAFRQNSLIRCLFIAPAPYHACTYRPGSYYNRRVFIAAQICSYTF